MPVFFYPRLGVLLLALGLLLGGSHALAFSFDDMEQLEQLEQAEQQELHPVVHPIKQQLASSQPQKICS
ncbi:hypothetical protein SAMN05421831_101171 [Allopseudospirillum japonicum]|uniref:Uncharacterized protein n=1 Tax=Allopseudospirillum japonicum TaxID=64971 RepID=A0A1H6QEI9_9GAMM|nr:hypothetical protein [Allopseudospirillum japonicum]SEI38647.1 hypothetical protein SAMN05421831_101171 [Allopseudospirillum japonicum]